MSEIQTPTAPAEEVAESASQEQTQEAVVTNEAQVEEPVEAETGTTAKVRQYSSKADLLSHIQELVAGEEVLSRPELDSLKSSYYHFAKIEAEEAFNAYVNEGGEAESYQPAPDADEEAFKEHLNVLRERRAAEQKAKEEERERNLVKKLQIIERIKVILEKPDEVNKSYKDFKTLQQEWNETGEVPATQSTDLWRNYQQLVEQFYDTLKLNNEFRAYDFKKNLEAKTAICESAEKLTEDPDPISAFRKLQILHQQFREVGPVARELRESVWDRFKAASTVINKRHQDFFEGRKAQEQENLLQKTAICEIVESFNLDELKSFADWNKIAEQITQLQAKWKTIGFAPQKHNVKIYERFRAACDNFFTKKSQHFKEVRSNLTDNLKLKIELCEQAEALKESTEWKSATEKFIQLQKRWREIGTVPKKYSDEIWQRFNTACEYFFDAKKKENSSQVSEQKENLEKKRSLVERLKAIATPEEATDELRDVLRTIQDEWNQIGHVPFKDKDKVFKAFRTELDRLYSAIGATATRRRVERFKSELKTVGADRLKDRLLRQYETLKGEIKTYENNLGFLNLTSKSKEGNSLVDELNRKVDKLRADLDEIKMKIKACDEQEDEDTSDESDKA
ncbi:MAG: DUF349 domain-containing protein [Bacteroidaceae bacterium]|nr:DUF349 domain-containing protein [Bacteroidaceae bacterium]